jgi:glutathione S-transferase
LIALLTKAFNRILGISRMEKNALEDTWNELHGALKAMEEMLSSHEYLAGASFTLVDIWSMPWISQLIDLKGADMLFSELPHLRNWWERVSLRPAWKEACGLMDGAMEVMRQNAASGWEL